LFPIFLHGASINDVIDSDLSFI